MLYKLSGWGHGDTLHEHGKFVAVSMIVIAACTRYQPGHRNDTPLPFVQILHKALDAEPIFHSTRLMFCIIIIIRPIQALVMPELSYGYNCSGKWIQ